MQKNMFLNIAGVAALTLLCACGGGDDKKEAVHQDAAHHAEAEMPNTEAMAQVEGQAVAVAEQAEGAMQVAEAEQPADADAAQQVAVADVQAEEQKA